MKKVIALPAPQDFWVRLCAAMPCRPPGAALAFNAPFAVEAEQRLAAAFGSRTAVEGLAGLRDKLGAPRSLHDLGMPQEGVVAVAEAVVAAAPAGNPRPVTLDAITELVRNAWEGAEPR